MEKKRRRSLRIDPDLLEQFAPDPDVKIEARLVGRSLVLTPIDEHYDKVEESSRRMADKYKGVLKKFAG